MSYLIIKPSDDTVVLDMTTPPTDGQVLAYNSSTGRWEPATSSGGSDPWTTVQLATDFISTNTIASPDDITGWTFTPAADKSYLIEFHALANAAATTTGIRPGYKSGMGGTIYCGMYVNVPNGAAGTFIRNFFGTGTQNSSATASPSTTPHYLHGQGMIIAGATPSGSFQMTLATEIAASAVTLLAGSIFRYREVS